jgi:SAM-dependent methyltransferase
LQAFYELPGYGAHTADDGKEFNRSRLELVFRFAKGRRLLDVGCGGGSFLGCARDLGWTATGIEPSSQGRFSASRDGLEVHHDFSVLLDEGRQFDVATIWHVLEHVPDARSFLRDVGFLLAPGGIVVVAVPNGSSARSQLLRVFPALRTADDDVYRAFPIHLYAFSRRSLRALLKACGFSVLTSTTQHFGVDECFRRRRSCPGGEAQQSGTSMVSPSGQGKPRRLLLPLKWVFFAAHLGESLVLVARKEAGQEGPAVPSATATSERSVAP